MDDMERVEIQSTTPAIDQLHSVADRFNEQVRYTSPRTTETKVDRTVLSPRRPISDRQHLTCLPIESCRSHSVRERCCARTSTRTGRASFRSCCMDGIAVDRTPSNGVIGTAHPGDRKPRATRRCRSQFQQVV